jgi:hypothetical protein
MSSKGLLPLLIGPPTKSTKCLINIL